MNLNNLNEQQVGGFVYGETKIEKKENRKVDESKRGGNGGFITKKGKLEGLLFECKQRERHRKKQVEKIRKEKKKQKS